ncbi:MAG: Nif3-like dinuclear metal center hexameric protein [Chitinophagaceae bacterium]
MKLKAITDIIESIAPLSYQESYDNAGLLTGNKEMEITGVLLALDTTEEIVDEAIRQNCNMILAHHPIVFKGLKTLTGKNYVERAIIKAIKNDIAIYAAHTNLDNVLQNGVNEKFAKKLNIKNLRILAPKTGLLCKIFVYVPENHLTILQEAMFQAGAGKIADYAECSFVTDGTGTFKPLENAQPFEGETNVRSTVSEKRLEVLAEMDKVNAILSAARSVHPYEEMAYEVVLLNNAHQGIGSGVVGELEVPMMPEEFLSHLKKQMNLELIRHTSWNKPIKKVAVCGGVGSFLIHAAARENVDAFITADVKYHEFFDVENRYMLCDIGHYESEISTLEIFYEAITKKFLNFAVIFCSISTNPIQYYK